MEKEQHSASPLDIPVGQRFRLLTPGERIQRGDECLNDDCETWSKVSVIVLRCDYNPMVFVPHRRQVPNAKLTGDPQLYRGASSEQSERG